ncbi:hypothetical protein ABPG74_009959 [Tetrahymena malaccensis]
MESQPDQDIQQLKKLQYLEGVLENEKGLKTINKFGGMGGFGVVLFVEAIKNPSEKYAVKVQSILDQSTGTVDKSLQKMCEDEAEVMRQCKHKNVVEIHSDYIINFYHFIQMNLCKCSLSDWIDNNQSPINDILFLHYTNQIIDGLEYLHNKQYILRDLSIRNILLTTEEVVKLCDFGLAKKYDQTLQSQILQTNNPKGVFFYFPPEVYEDMNNSKAQVKQTMKGDIWALGICLSLLGGTKIFEFLNVQNKNFQIPRSPKISQKANLLIQYILNRDPQQRPTIKQIREKICDIFLNNPDQGETNNSSVDTMKPMVINIKSKESMSNISTYQNTIDSQSSLKIERIIDFDFDQCEKIYQKYTKFNNQFQLNIDYLLTLGFLEAKYKSNYQKAQEIFERVLELDENETDALIGLCHCIMQLRLYKEFPKLLKYSDMCLNKDPKNWRAQYYKAFYYCYQGNSAKSLEILQKLLIEQPQCCEALSLKLYALDLIEIKDYKDFLDKIISLNKNNNPIVFYRIGIYYKNRNEKQKSLHFLNKSLEFTPNELTVLTFTAYVQNDNQQEAQKLLSKAQQLYPQNCFLFRQKADQENNKQSQLNFINKSIELDSSDIWSIQKKAEILKSLQKYKESLEFYEKIILINPNYTKAYYYMAQIYGSQLNQKEKAIDLLKNCIKEDPHCTDYYEELQEIYKNQKNMKEFEKIIKQNIEKSNKKLFLSRLLAAISLDEKNYDQFIQYINKAIQIDPKDCQSLNMYAEYFKLIKNDLKQAKLYYEKVYELDPKYSSIYFNLAYVEEQNIEKKIQYYKKHLELYPNSSVTINNLGVILQEQDKKQEALKLYQKAFQNDQNSTLYSSNIQNTLKQLNLYDQALEQCELTLKIDQKHSGSYKIKGEIYSERKESHKAIENFLKALELDQSKTFLYEKLANEYYELKNLQEALKYYQKDVQHFPNSPESLYRIGLLQISLNNNINEAISCFEKSIQARPSNNAQACKELGLLQIKKQLYTQAKQNLIKAIQQDTSNKNLYLNLSKIEQNNLKNMKQSILYLEEFIKFCPTNQDEKINLIEMYIEEKEYVKSRQLIQQYIKDSPQNDYIYFLYGRLEFRENNFYQAIAQYEKALKKKKDFFTCIFNIGLCYQNLLQYKKAVEYYSKYNKVEKKCGRGYFLIGKIQLYNFNQPKRAIQYFKKCQEKSELPNNPFNQNECYYHIGKCFIEINYVSEAISQFTKYLQKNPSDNVKFCQEYIKNYQNVPKKFYKYQPLEDSNCSCSIF